MKTKRELAREYPVAATFRFRSQEEREAFHARLAKLPWASVANVRGERGIVVPVADPVLVDVLS